MRRPVLSAAATMVALFLISGVALAAELIGTPGDDRLAGTDKRDVISARGGDDTVIGRRGDDELYGMPGGDSISGSEGADDVYGGSGNDGLRGGDDRWCRRNWCICLERNSRHPDVQPAHGHHQHS